MDIKIVVTADGQVQALIEKGTFKEGAERLAELIDALRADGIEVAELSPIESHRGDGEHVHVGGVHVHHHNHS